MTEFLFSAASLEDTDRLAAALAEFLPAGTVVSLCGTLGAGKTRLTQGMAAFWGIDPERVVSPTFVLCQQYEGARTLVHFDAYRLHDDDEFLELGAEEFFDSPAITVVEWGDRVVDCLPRERVEIEIDVVDDTRRQFRVNSRGQKYVSTIEQIATKLAASAEPGV